MEYLLINIPHLELKVGFFELPASKRLLGLCVIGFWITYFDQLILVNSLFSLLMIYIFCVSSFSYYVVSSWWKMKIAVSTASWPACSVNSWPSAILSWDKLHVVSVPQKPAAVAVEMKWEMTVTALVTWIVASWMPVVNHQTVWKSVWNAAEFVFLHKYLSFVCVKTGECFKKIGKGEEKHMVRFLWSKQPSICTVNAFKVISKSFSFSSN